MVKTPDELREQVRRSLAVWLQDRLARRPGATSAVLAGESDEVPNLPRKLIGRQFMVEARARVLQDGGRVLLQASAAWAKTALAATVGRRVDRGRAGRVLWLHAGANGA